MKRYYEIRPINGRNYNQFDTIKYVAERIGIPDYIFIDKYFSCYSYTDLIFELMGKRVIHQFFDSNLYIAKKLNQILIDYDIPLRISQEGAYVRVRHDSKG